MTLPEAQAIVAHFGVMAYLNKFQVRVLSQAKAVVKTAAEQAMSDATGGLCVPCGGDGFHRVNDALIGGPCHVCKGTGRRALTSQHETGGGK